MLGLSKYKIQQMIRIWILFFLCIVGINHVYSQRIYGAEMYKETLIDTKVEVRIWREFYSKPFIMFDWGDNSPLDTLFLHSTTPPYPAVYKVDEYHGSHYYNTTGYFRMGFVDSFLVADIANIEDSGNKSIALFDTIAIFEEGEFLRLNSSPIFFRQQGNISFIDGKVVFGNSLEGDPYFPGDMYRVYLEPFPSEGYSIPTYTDSLTLSIGGYLVWDHPITPGRYAIGMNLKEYRANWVDGILLDTVLLSTTLRAMTMIIDEDFIVSNSKEEILKGVVSLFPNPTSNWLYLQICCFQIPVQVRIFDDKGRQVYEEQRAASNVMEEWCIWVRDWPPGLYLVQIETGGHVVTRKIVVQQ